MKKSRAEVQAEAKQLSASERALLVRELISSLDEGADVDAEQAWLDEAERRLAAHRRGELTSAPAAEVFAALLQQRG